MAETLRCYRHPDRETGVSCSECARGICPDCMRFAPVGIRCPDHSGEAQGAKRVVQRAQVATAAAPGLVAKTLVGLNVGIYLLSLALGGDTDGRGSSVYLEGVLFGPLVAEGEWWRLLTSAFLHGGIFHLGMNMLVLWWFGPALEQLLGSGRFLLLYLSSGLAGAAGALIDSPDIPVVGASGAIYGLFGAILVLERQGTFVFGASVIPLLAINFALTFFVPWISKGGHIGGFVGGILGLLLVSRFGRRRVVGGARFDALGVAGIVAVGVLSVAVAFWQVGLT